MSDNNDLIIIRCPYTGMNVQTSLRRQSGNPDYESVSCPACARPHLVDKSSGKVAGANR